MTKPDVLIIGSGMGGATLAAALAPSGRNILILERGERLEPSPRDRDATSIFIDGCFRPDEQWLDGSGKPFNPGNYYYAGGNSKFFGAVMLRYRAEDFEPLQHVEGATPGWPFSYDELEPFYQKAEDHYRIRGALGEDPTEPPHSGTYPFPPVPDEPTIADLRARLSGVGLHPSSLPLGVDIDHWLAHGLTTWDAYPDTCGGKMDAETVSLNEALQYPNVTLQTGSLVRRIVADEAGKIAGVEIDRNGQAETIEAGITVLSAGAVQSAALLLASQDANNPNGLANSSDQVGRNFMNHNTSAVIAIRPLRKNTSVYQKTLMVNDFYLRGGPDDRPMGNIQLLGKITEPILAANTNLPRPLVRWITDRSIDLYAMSEDLPNPESRVTLRDGRIVLDWKQSNFAAHNALVVRLKKLLRQAGYPIVLSRPFDRRTPSHQCGTARMGHDPRASVVDPFGRSHDHPNLFIADASTLPTSAAVNPALTVAALSLRMADHILEKDFAT
ncbi:GMC oxidoreductase [Amaricoccus tamworthensis]|uniref:GMC oxidoreductase n=1 Tax=Amaricoccus tamworthensis TaxID=57002 RepID=UPI003C7CCBD5